MRGRFIVLEGLDRCGKTTQVARLVERVGGVLQKFPDRTTAIGSMINAYLQSETNMDDHAIHLLFSANRWEVAARIHELVESGVTVVADRYAFSGIAFSAAKGLPFDYCLQPDKGLPLPDLVIYLTLSPDAASARGEYGQERYETLQMQERTRAQFALVAAEFEARHPGRWKEVDAAGSIEEVAARIWAVVEGVQGGEGRLWV